MYSYGPSNQCVRECPPPYRGYAPNSSCVLNCPTQYYFYDVTTNICNMCDPNCIVCISFTNCIQCKAGFNLFSGVCNISCIPTNGVITYSNPNGICVGTCPVPYFGDKSIYTCVQVCPNKQYGEPTTRLCTGCPATCAQCSSPTHCTVC
jgi:hypothetical protein